MSDKQDGDWDFVIHTYTLDQAIEDGVLVEFAKNRWPQLSGGKPIVATAAINAELSQAALVEIWNEYAVWRREVMATLPVEDQMFTTTMNGRTVWVLDDGAAFTVLFPEDY